MDGGKQGRVKDVFSAIAQRYDLLNSLLSFGLHRRWRRASLILAGGVSPGARALDLCCGTGDYIREVLRLSGGTAQVFGVDFSHEMLAVAARRLTHEISAGSVKLLLGDVTDLSFLEPASCDLATIGFGLRNLDDVPAALRGARRALKPGAPLVSLELCRPFPPLVAPVLRFHLRAVVPALGALVAGKLRAYQWLYESLRTFPDRRELARMLTDAGYAPPQEFTFGLGAVVAHIARPAC